MPDPPHHPPLNWESSASATHPQITTTLPPEVETCLQNARFLHLATCHDLHPHISLMNYTYLPSSPFQPSPHPLIIMTTNPSSKKHQNLLRNPNVSLLVHDWVSHRPPTRNPDLDMGREGSPPREAEGSSLARMLLNLNTSALSSISATIEGEARVVERGAEEERWCKERHLENHTFGEGGAADGGGLGRVVSGALGGGLGGGGEGEGDGGKSCYIEGEEVRVVVVGVTGGRIADWKGGVKDWTLAAPDGGGIGERGRVDGLVNGISS